MTSQNTKNILFVSDLSKETTFKDLELFFSKYNFQFAALNNSKSSTWGQVYLDSEESAIKAKNELNGELLIPQASISHQGKPIRICRYEKRGSLFEKNINQSLLVKNLDKKMTQKEFYQLFLQYGDIESAKIDYDELGVSKGFGYIYYTSSESAEKAKMDLNSKQFYDKKIEIVNLMPIKSKDFTNSLFIKNFPSDFKESDLKKLFEKYGIIKHVSISRDQNSISKGYAIISFTDFEMTSRCLNECNKNELAFPGLQPLSVKFAARKEERENKNNMNNMPSYSSDLLKIQFNLEFATDDIENSFDLEKEIRLFIKVIMLQEYNPKEVVVNLEAYSGLVTFKSKKDFDLYCKMYEEFCLKHVPSFHCIPYTMKKNAPMIMLPPQNQMQNMSINNNHYHQGESIPINTLNIEQIQPNNNNNTSGNNSSLMFQNMILLNNDIPKVKNNPNQQRRIIQKPYLRKNDQMHIIANQQYQHQSNGFNEDNIPIWPGDIPMHNMPIPIRPPFNSPIMKMVPQNIQNNQIFNTHNPDPQMPFIPQEEMFNQHQPYFRNIENKMNSQDIYQQQQQKEKRNNKYIDLRNLQELNLDQLQSQFNKPAQHIFNPDMFNHDDDEEIANEIAESIYEIAFKKYPK